MDKPNASATVPAAAASVMAGQPRADESPYEYYRRTYRDAPYYSSGRTWSDYAPAYRYAMETVAAHAASAVDPDACEAVMAAGWEAARDGSRLSWPEARGAIRHVLADAWVRLVNGRMLS